MQILWDKISDFFFAFNLLQLLQLLQLNFYSYFKPIFIYILIYI